MNGLLRNILPVTRQIGCRLMFANYSTDTGSKDYLDSLVKGKKVVVFMKGTPDAPRCGFSNAVVQMMNMHGVTEFEAHDVLADEPLRQGVKDYSNWPTIPQVFMGGEFVGGCDIMLEMHQNGEFIEELKKVDIRSALIDQEGK